MTVDKITIPEQKGLDPVNVYFENYDKGQGRIIIVCYDMAWTAYWGAMGDRTIQQFVTECGADYIAGNLGNGQHYTRSKRTEEYLGRIVKAIHEHLTAQKETK